MDGQIQRSKHTTISLARHFLVAFLAIVIIAVVTRMLQGNSPATGTQSTSVIALATPIITGNCSDARAFAREIAPLAMLAGHPVVQLQLAPTQGCASDGQVKGGYRSSVRLAQLTVVLSSIDWDAASSQIKRQLPLALLHSLHRVYPHARCQVDFAIDGRTVVRASA